MPNTNLRTDLTPGATGNIADRNTVHTEVNRLSRDTGWRVIPLLNGWTLDAGGFARIKRVDDRTTVRFCGLNATGATSGVIFHFNASEGVDPAYRGSDPLRSPLFPMGPNMIEFRIAASQFRMATNVSIPASVVLEWTWHADRGWVSSFTAAV